MSFIAWFKRLPLWVVLGCGIGVAIGLALSHLPRVALWAVIAVVIGAEALRLGRKHLH
jgi:hypothetical protein